VTPLLAATATPDHPVPWGWLLLALVVWTGWYLASCAWFPFARCWSCDGAGRKSRKDGKVWRNCRRCRASGKRLRVGRRVWNRFANVRKEAGWQPFYSRTTGPDYSGRPDVPTRTGRYRPRTYVHLAPSHRRMARSPPVRP
jgi:hypothetical protein